MDVYDEILEGYDLYSVDEVESESVHDGMKVVENFGEKVVDEDGRAAEQQISN